MLLIVLSCEKEYIPDIDHQNDVIVLNSFFSSDTSWFVNLSNSVSPFIKNDILPILDAEIIIENGDNIVAKDFVYIGNGNYTSNVLPKSDNNYIITINHKKYKNVYSSSHIPKKIRVESFSKLVKINSENEKVLETNFVLSHGKQVYLIFRHIINKKSISINKDTITYSDTAWIQGYGGIFESTLPTYADNDMLFVQLAETGETNISFQSFDGFVKDEKLISGISKFEIFTCSEAYYNYQKSLQIFNWNKNENNSSIINPSSIYNNIENGLGIFAGFDKEVVISKFK